MQQKIFINLINNAVYFIGTIYNYNNILHVGSYSLYYKMLLRTQSNPPRSSRLNAPTRGQLPSPSVDVLV